MKPTIRSLICAATVLSAFCAPIPAVRANDATDYAHQLYQAQKEREQAQHWQAQKDREDWQAQRDYHQSILDGIERVKQQRDAILNKAYDDHPWARAGWTAGAEWTAAGWMLPQSATPPPKVQKR